MAGSASGLSGTTHTHTAKHCQVRSNRWQPVNPCRMYELKQQLKQKCTPIPQPYMHKKLCCAVLFGAALCRLCCLPPNARTASSPTRQQQWRCLQRRWGLRFQTQANRSKLLYRAVQGCWWGVGPSTVYLQIVRNV